MTPLPAAVPRVLNSRYLGLGTLAALVGLGLGTAFVHDHMASVYFASVVPFVVGWLQKRPQWVSDLIGWLYRHANVTFNVPWKRDTTK